MAFHALSIIRENDTSATFVDMSQHIINEAELVNVVSQWRAQCLSICSIALMVWDTIITIDQEVERIWRPRPRISLIKMFFWINRWLTPLTFGIRIYRFSASNPSFQSCFTAFVYTQIAQVMIVGIIQSALAIRVWALYEQNRGVLGLFILLVGGSTIYAAVINWVCLRFVWNTRQMVHRDVFQSACNQISPQFPSIYRTTFYSALVLEVVFFLMTIIQVFRRNRSAAGAPLLSHIARTGTVFFFLAFIAILFAVIGSLFPASYAPATRSNFLLAILSINCSRMILGIRGAFQMKEHFVERSTTQGSEQYQHTTMDVITEIEMADLENLMCVSLARGHLREERELATVAEEDEDR